MIAGTMLTPEILLQILWTSVASASYQVLFALAFALVLKVTKIWNFTLPAQIGVSFYTMYTAIMLVGLPAPAAIALGLLAPVALAYGTERWAFQVLRERNSDSIAFFIFALIFASFATFLLTLIFTTAPTFMLPDMMSPLRLVGGVVVTDWDVLAIAVAAITLAMLWAVLRLTRWGQYLIAVADNADLAEVYGIDRRHAYRLAAMIAALLTGIGTALAGGKLAFSPDLGSTFMVYAVAATILGGIGNVFAAGFAAIAISVLQQTSVLVFESRWQTLIVFVVLFAAILFFPKGVRWPARRIARGGGGLGPTVPAAVAAKEA